MAVNTRRLRYTLYLSGFVDLFGVSLLIPVLTREARKYDASPFDIGLFGSLYGFLQLFSSPLVGMFSDHFGRYLTLLICLFGASSGYMLLAFADSFFLMVLSRIPNGIFKHSQSLAKAYLVDITEENERSAVFGTFNSIAALGFIVGPLLGGHIVTLENGFSKIAVLTSMTCWLNAALLYMTFSGIEVTSRNESSKPDSKSKKDLKIFNIISVFRNIFTSFIHDIKYVPWHCIWDVFLIKFLSSLAVTLFRSTFATILEFRYNVEPKVIGYVIAFNAIISTFGGLSIGHIQKQIKKASLLHNLFMFMMLIALLGLAFAPSIPVVLIFIVPLSISTSVLRACNSALVYSKASDQEVGLLAGLSSSTLSVSRMMAPAIGGLCQEYSDVGAGLLASLLAGLGLLLGLVCDLDGTSTKGTKAH